MNSATSTPGNFLMLQEKAIAAHEEYRKQLRRAFSALSEAEQDYANKSEELLVSVTNLADGFVEWGESVLESMRSEDAPDIPDAAVRKMVNHFTEVVSDLLRLAVDTDDDYSTRVFCEQAKKVADILDVVQRSWHWADVDKIEESWRQHQRGELMDFETFKNELLTPEE